MVERVDIPEVVQNKALLDEQEGRRWIDDVPDRLARLTAQWSLDVRSQLTGGTEALVFAVTLASGEDAVLKLAVPGGLGSEPTVLRLADGRGYASLHAADATEDALLLERLGPQLAESDLPTQTQIAIIVETLMASWSVDVDVARAPLPTATDKAEWHIAHINRQFESLAPPLSAAVRGRALGFCEERAAAFDVEDSVLIHGDAHPWNTLAAAESNETGVPRYKFVDPDGAVGEKALDLCICLREWQDELVAGEPADTVALGRQRCDSLAAMAEVDPEPIWQWAFIEHVSSGLLWQQTGNVDEAAKHYTIAERWLSC